MNLSAIPGLTSNRRENQILNLLSRLFTRQKMSWIVDLRVRLHITPTDRLIGLVEKDRAQDHHMYKEGVHFTKLARFNPLLNGLLKSIAY